MAATPSGSTKTKPLYAMQPSQHHFWLNARLIAGPVAGPLGGSGWLPIAYFFVWAALFAVYMTHVATGIWVALGPVVVLISLWLLKAAAYSDPGVLPRGWQIKQCSALEALDAQLGLTSGYADDAAECNHTSTHHNNLFFSVVCLRDCVWA